MTLPDDPASDGGTVDTGTIAIDSGGVDSATGVDSGGSEPVMCGATTCPAGETCCNASCGICTPPGGVCPDIACVDSGVEPCVGCPAPPDGCRYEGSSCESCGELVCDERRCGGFAGSLCGGDQYCDYDSGCGFADGSGVCRPRPELCQDDCPGVCGCDGETYCNACDAAVDGVDVLHEGACETTPPPAMICGTIAGLGCSGRRWCDYGGCPGPDAAGVCRRRPEGCDDIYRPVCGCDGRTYSNECEAEDAGMNVRYEGECRSSGGGP